MNFNQTKISSFISYAKNSSTPLTLTVLKAALVGSMTIAAVACIQPESNADQTQPISAEHSKMQHEDMAHTDGKMDHSAHKNMTPNEPAEALGQDYSIYQIGGQWTDHKGNAIELEDLKGKNQVVVMAYTSCQHTCPILVRGMKQIENEMTADARANTEFVLVTLDTKRDTVTVMNNYADHNNLGENWRLIRSDEATTRMLANTLNIKYQFADNGDINHSNLISILDKEGRLVAQEIGIADSGLNPLIEYLNSHS